MRISDWSSDVCSSDLFPGAPRRELTETIRQDAAGQALGDHILPLIQNDNPAAAEALLGPAEAELSPNALTEWRQRVAWSYYIENDDANRSEEHTSELQSLMRISYAVFCLKKKNNRINNQTNI